MQVKRTIHVGVFCLLLGLLSLSLSAGEKLVVHEWGTFTSLQNELGEELSGINTDDEPVPGFVHNLNPYIFSKPVLASPHWRYRQKAAPRVHPRITMRLETPVVYFYPPPSWDTPRKIELSVRFRGGWLTEFYPRATPAAPGLKEGNFDFGELTSRTESSLSWRDLAVGTDAPGPKTDDRVWTAPRHVPAASVTTPEGESERYLFYRGVGQVHSPLRATMDRKDGSLALRGNFDEVLSPGEKTRLSALWLVQVREDGELAFRTLDPVEVSNDREAILGRTDYRFADGDFSESGIARLQGAMHTALAEDGLTADEATALLSTWKRSYFTSPGLRLFFLVPRAWTDHYLPLSISTDAEIDRVFVGRLELISDHQRALLDRLANTANSDGSWVELIPEGASRERFLAGRTDFGDLGIPIPPDFQMYLALGRFRNALVAHEERVRPTGNLERFVETYGLEPFRIPSVTSTIQR